MTNTVKCGNIRIQFLTADIIRVEYDKKQRFCDQDTFFIPAKSRMEGYEEYTVSETAEAYQISFGDKILLVSVQAASLCGVEMLNRAGDTLYQGECGKNSGELPALDKTPQVFALYDTPRILVPQGGYTYRGDIVNSGYEIDESAQDVYLLLCEGNAQKLRRLYVELTGKNEMVRLSVLGAWNSRFYEYSEESAKGMIEEFMKREIPLDNLVLDTDWRAASDRGIGYDVNTKLFPDMKRFIDYAHDKNVEIMFNDHPEPVDGAASVLDSAEVKYREEKLQSLMKLGLDTWWYDRNWITSLISPTRGLEPETWGLAIFHDVTENFYKKQAGENEPIRPIIMGNINDIVNGNYRAIRDSASHRYSIQWTGDNCSDRESIANDMRNILQAGNNAIGYANFDCGGHIGNPEKELYLRWIQFGSLSPIFRPHCTKGMERYREPWKYADEEIVDICRQYYKLRYRLLPVLYKSAYENYESGTPICKALGWLYPKDEKAHAIDDEYMLGSNLLVAPIYGGKFMKLPQEWYTTPVKATYYNGTEWKGEPVWENTYDKLSLYFERVSPGGNVPVYEYSAVFETELIVEEDVDLIVEANDGLRVKIDDVQTYESIFGHSALLQCVGVLSAGKRHKVRIEYCQFDHAACVSLHYRRKTGDLSTRMVYLPSGTWMDLFDGQLYTGNKTYEKTWSYNTMPLFVRLGGMIPLAKEVQTTAQQKWNVITFDYYPSKEAEEKDYLYEDDTCTTAYKLDEYRKTPYSAKYDEKSNQFTVIVGKAEGEFRGEKCFASREITIRYHLLPEIESVKKVLVNGQESEFVILERNSDAFPLRESGAAPDNNVLLVKFTNDVSKEVQIEFVLV